MGLKQYIYLPSQLGLDHWPNGLLRLDFERTGNSSEADLYVIPGNFTKLFRTRDEMYARLPYFKGNEHRHVMMSIGEDNTVYDLPSIFLRSNLKTWMLERDENSIAIPWPVEDFSTCVEPPSTGFTHDVSFHGWVSTKRRVTTRARAVGSCRDHTNLKCDFKVYPDFYGHQPAHEQAVRRLEYKLSLQRSRIVLCPESIPGDIPYRFYEAMSAGRVAMLIGSDYVLPFEDKMPRCCFLLGRDLAGSTGEHMTRWRDQWDDEGWMECGRRMRYFWESLLAPDVWLNSFTQLATVQIQKIKKESGVDITI